MENIQQLTGEWLVFQQEMKADQMLSLFLLTQILHIHMQKNWYLKQEGKKLILFLLFMYLWKQSM